MLQETLKFELPSFLNAAIPPERRGVRRDHVKLMVLNKETGKTKHDQFYHIERYLKKGDVLVLNSSRTVPAILRADLNRRGQVIQENLEIRLARRKNEGVWEALVVGIEVKIGDELRFSKDLVGLAVNASREQPFTTIQFSKQGMDLYNAIYSLGEPVRYEYINNPWGLDYYQTVFATHPGSVEMPSAGRAFSWELLFKLQRAGIRIVFIQLHTGLSYFLDDKWSHSPSENEEEYQIPQEAWETILEAKGKGNRVIAVGTTVVRAIETAIIKRALSGWTNLYIQPDYQLKMIDGIITGMHEPEASHLEMLSAFVNPSLLIKAYQEAIDKGYLWHEFGDMNLIL